MRFWTPGALYTALIVLICVVIVQFHAIHFWSEHAAYITGWLWAIGLEMLVLWLWFQRRLGYQLVGIIGTTILLAGPVYTISSDLLETLEYAQSDEDSRQSQIAALKGDIERLEEDLATFRQNSEERTGWLPIIRDTQQEIAKNRVELRELQGQRDEADTLWLTAALLVVQVVAVVLFHIGAILGITWLSRHRDRVMERRARSTGKGVVEQPAASTEQGMEHRSMEHPTEPMEQAPAERMEHPTEPMEQAPAERMEQASDQEGQTAVAGSAAIQTQPAPPPAKGNTNEVPLAAILRAVDKLQRHLDQTDDTISRFADRNNIPRRDVSLFLRHKENLDAGKRCASMAKIRTIMAAIPE